MKMGKTNNYNKILHIKTNHHSISYIKLKENKLDLLFDIMVAYSLLLNYYLI